MSTTIKIKDGDGNDKYYQVNGAGTLANPYRNVTEGIFFDSPNIDAFARLRISNPETIFDSKQLFNTENGEPFWDDAEVSGGSTTSTYTKDEASTVIQVAASTAGKRVRQTYMSFNYQPGKSQLIFMTGTLDKSGGGTGITRGFGQFNDDNGIFLNDNEGTYEFVIRSSYTGSAVDNNIAQASWNLDTMDGNGDSGVTLDFTKSQILVFDYEWLGVGRVRCGFVIGGAVIYAHEFNHSNINEGVYMSTPNLPLRYEIANDGTGVQSELEHICASVIAEGGSQDIGVLRYESNGSTNVDANVVGTIYALVGISLQTGATIGGVIKQLTASLIATTADDFEWQIILNPTVAGIFIYSAHPNSIAATAVASGSSNTVTGGIPITGGYGSQSAAMSTPLNVAEYVGEDLSGTPDRLVLCVRPLGANLDIYGSLTWRELS